MKKLTKAVTWFLNKRTGNSGNTHIMCECGGTLELKCPECDSYIEYIKSEPELNYPYVIYGRHEKIDVWLDLYKALKKAGYKVELVSKSHYSASFVCNKEAYDYFNRYKNE